MQESLHGMVHKYEDTNDVNEMKSFDRSQRDIGFIVEHLYRQPPNSSLSHGS